MHDVVYGTANPATQRVLGLLKALRFEERDVAEGLSLTANENRVSKAGRLLIASPLGERYLLGTTNERLPSPFVVAGRLMLRGLPRVIALEQAANRAAAKIFAAQMSDFRPLSGMHTTLCTIALLTRPGDAVYSISPAYGGHFATRPILHRLGRRSHYLPWDSRRMCWDEDGLSDVFRRSRPAAILLDHGVALGPLPIAALRTRVGPRVLVLYDASHTFGLIAGGVFPNPLCEGCDVLQGNTHKTFPGPHKGMLHFRSRRIGCKVRNGLSAGFVSSQHTHHALALYVAMLEMEAFGEDYARRIVANAAALGGELEKRGFELLRAGAAPTASNLLIVKKMGALDPYQACEALLRVGVATNARMLNGQPVLRIGTQEVTRRGMLRPEMQWIADVFYSAVIRRDNPDRLRRKVMAFSSTYKNVHYSFDRTLGLWN